MYLLASGNSDYTWNVVVYSLEIIALIVAIVMIIVGLLQPKQAQTGLSALNGGNEELFSNNKERGMEKNLSVIMTWSGSIIFVLTTIIAIFTNIFLL